MSFIVYSANTLQVMLLFNNLLSMMKHKKYLDIEVIIQLEVAFLTNEDRKDLYASYNIYNEEQQISHNHRKVLTVYCAPKFRNTPEIHLLRTFSSDPELKYLTSGIQQRFFPSRGAYITYQYQRALSAYLADLGRI